MKERLAVFVSRWVFNSLGLWIAAKLLGTGYEDKVDTAGIFGFLFAGLVFSIVNSVLKPILVILSMPAILVSLGLFMVIVNGILVYVSLMIAPGISMSFVNSILTGMLLGLINYLTSSYVELNRPYNYRRTK
jgi:putative membrane protein